MSEKFVYSLLSLAVCPASWCNAIQIATGKEALQSEAMVRCRIHTDASHTKLYL